MKIGLFSTYDGGGAGKAAARLNRALNSIGECSNMFVKYKQTNDNNIIKIDSNEINNTLLEDLSKTYFKENIKTGNTMSSIMYPSIGFSYLDFVKELDIVNLHWIPGLVSIEAIAKIHSMKKPMVWTLHDENPFTGACHYTSGCEKFKTNCSECPQLLRDEVNITKEILKLKSEKIPEDIVIVTPSIWLAETAKESRVLKNNRIEVIPNSIDMKVYTPVKKEIAKENLGIDPNVKVILFGADDITEKRKGFELLLEAMDYLKKEEYIQDLISNNKLLILNFGNGNDKLKEMDLPQKSLGYIREERELANIYSASDVVVLPSLEDNLPNIMIEGMACGTPVVGFEIGGLKDAVIENETGYLCKLKDTKALALNIEKALKNKNLSKKCAEFARNKYSQDIQAKAYSRLYKEIIDNNHSSKYYVDKIPYIFPSMQKHLINYMGNLYSNKEAEVIRLNDLHCKDLYKNEELQNENKKLTKIINEKNDEILELSIKNEESNKNLIDLKNRYDDANEELRSTYIKYEKVLAMKDQLKNELKIETECNIELQKEIDNIYSSRSWKITKPLRICFRYIKKIMN